MSGGSSDPRPILVTGGAGFIGVHTVEALLAAGSRVVVIDDLRHASARALHPSVDVVMVDVVSQAAREHIVRIAPRAILHLAAQGGVSRSWREPMDTAANNILGTLGILAASEEAGCRRVVIASSGGALYGRAARLPTPEDEPQAPRSPYGTSKASAEAFLGTYTRLRGCAGLALRYGNVYGPGQDGTGEAGVVAITCERLLSGRAPAVRGDGSQTRDFVFVGDVAQANVRAIESAATGAVNIGTGVETSVARVAALLAELRGHDGPMEHVPLPSGEVTRSCLATGEAATLLGWQATTELERGLRDTWIDFTTRNGAPGAPAAAPAS